MKKLMALVCAVMMAAGINAQALNLGDGTKVKQGQAVPQFKVETVNGATVDMASLKGQVVLVNFWATWCPPCRSELKRVPKEIAERFAGKDFVLLAISRGEKRDVVEKFLAKEGYTFNAGLDPDGKIFGLFAENSIPRNFLVDRQGKIAFISIGYEEGEFSALTDKIDELLKKK